MSFICPFCGCTTMTRTSDKQSTHSRRGYHQCKNICCGATFTTLQTVEHVIAQPRLALDDATLKTLIRAELFLPRHFEAAQIQLNLD
ncbi:ogr/Delta-like zinc finger family protein [Escherichia coli]|nr:ogr/Delta-like zinc finger family protein [Escherichia coli]